MNLRKLSFKKITFYLFFLLFGISSNAGLLIDNNLFYYTNSLSTSKTESYNHYHLAASFSASVNKAYFLGWKSSYYSDTQKGSAGTMTVNGLEMGPRAGVYLSKSKWSSLSIAYLPIHTGTYSSDTGTVSKLSGSGFQFEFTFAPEVYTNLSPGISLLYHLGSYSTSENSTNTTSSVSYSRNGFFPSIYLHWNFGDE